jgi:hypothetical protein
MEDITWELKNLDSLKEYIFNELIVEHKNTNDINKAINTYAERYHEMQLKLLGVPVVVENKELPVYKVVFNEGTDDGVTSINLTKTPLFNAKQTGEHLRSSCDWCNPPQRK